MDQLLAEGIWVQFPNFSNVSGGKPKPIQLQKNPVSFATYQQAFDIVKKHLLYGNSYLTNLTFATPIVCEEGLRDLFDAAQAKYKILFKDEWVCFSPETFITITENQISSRPMKGTIDAAIPNAEEIILKDKKETAEHYTIVDLIRNDVSIQGENTRVEKFRYIDEITTSHKNLLQVSSHIVADRKKESSIADIILSMLPAGSISGAPKQKTMEIIAEAETSDRGFYTGTAYYFDGKELDSCVLIRFIEKTQDGLLYRSGGGITIHSDAEKEYQEMLDKIYVPTI